MKKQYIIAICIIAFFTSLIITMNIVKENKLQKNDNFVLPLHDRKKLLIKKISSFSIFNSYFKIKISI